MSTRRSRGRTRNALADITPSMLPDDNMEVVTLNKYYEYRESTISRSNSSQRKRASHLIADMDDETPNVSSATEDPFMRPDAVSFFQTPGIFKYRRRTSTEPQIDYFEHFQIPNECILKIFENFNKRDVITAMKVCRKFYNLGENKDLWKTVDLANKTIRLVDLFKIVGRGCQVLRLCGTKINEEEQDEAMLHQGYGMLQKNLLTHIDFSRCTISTLALETILCGTNLLQGLSLENVNLSTRILEAIGQNTDLLYLDLSMARGIKTSDIKCFLPQLTKIEELNLSWCNLDAEALNRVMQYISSSVQRICLAGSRNKASLFDSHVEALCRRCVTLKEVDLSDSTELTRASLQFLIDMPQLEVLSLSRCFGIHPLAYLSCANIARLNIFGCVTEEGEQTLRIRLQNTAVNMDPHSSVARPTPPPSVTSIWRMKVKDLY
ncbi:unnamed protein product, partial [Mesorhabditis belari]|uniref:F-box domain-containing protein n=1 Tax=Mesorhabditis belari TaxID=2138241 RepID=A0AAF3F276_9BILA